MSMRCFDCGYYTSFKKKYRGCWWCGKSLVNGTGYKEWIPGTDTIYQRRGVRYYPVPKKEQVIEIKEVSEDSEDESEEDSVGEIAQMFEGESRVRLEGEPEEPGAAENKCNVDNGKNISVIEGHSNRQKTLETINRLENVIESMRMELASLKAGLN
jgi:hypothetical protein